MRGVYRERAIRGSIARCTQAQSISFSLGSSNGAFPISRTSTPNDVKTWQATIAATRMDGRRYQTTALVGKTERPQTRTERRIRLLIDVIAAHLIVDCHVCLLSAHWRLSPPETQWLLPLQNSQQSWHGHPQFLSSCSTTNHTHRQDKGWGGGRFLGV